MQLLLLLKPLNAQAVEWLNFKGYTATFINRPLTTEEIKNRLDNSEPIVPVLENQNPENWLHQSYAGVLYAHDDVETGTTEGKIHASFIKTVNYGEAIINDGDEGKNFQFPDLKNSPDPLQADSSFKWVSTLTGIKRDPSWTNAQTIEGDKAKGVFEHKVTSDGSQSQVDFTDSEVTALLNKYPSENKDHVSKLAAVSLINLYEDKEHQKTAKDLEEFLKIDANTYVTSQNIMDWYAYLGFDFDVVNGRAPMNLTKAINDSGRLYLTMFKPQDKNNVVKSSAVVGAGYLNNSFSGYSPYWYALKLGENLVPFYDVPLTNEGLAQQQKLAKEFKYTNVKRVVSDPFSKTDYEEDKTIYNIRLKGTPDESGITIKPDESVETEIPEITDEPTTNAKYTKAPDFNIRETQGQQPWCTAYVNAGAVNTTHHAGANAITSAKDIMKLDRPGISDEELENLPGTTVGNMLDVIKKNYGVTADFEERTLSFAEVKKEIDAGGIIEMDGYDSEDPEGPGNGGKGHAVSIVGYVEPTESGKSPYYIVWNPWWDTTFYLSSQSKTFNLGGVKYKWYRTWHNWRKTDGTRAEQVLPPELRDKEVANTTNPYPTKEEPLSTPLQEMRGLNINLFNFNSNNDILNQNVSQNGHVIKTHDGFSGADYSYQINTGAYSKKYMIAQRSGVKKETDYNGTAVQFQQHIDSIIKYQFKVVSFGLSSAVIFVLLALANTIPIVGELADAIALVLGGGYAMENVVQIAETLLLYKRASDETTRLFNVL